jgi:cell division septation protein DedD
MPALNNRERDREYDRESDRGYRDQRQDREISLGTGTILAIFFALALLCAVFFGFGYSMGRKSAQPAAVASSDSIATGSLSSSVKPSAGSSVIQPSASSSSALPSKTHAAAPRDPDAEIVTRVVDSSEDTPVTPKPHSTPAATVAPDSSTALAVHPAPKAAVTPQQAVPSATPNGVAMVQVAAVSHQEDADVLLAALRKRGYDVFIRQEAQDHLLHVQLGPFATKKDAEVVRQRLLSDGYNAIVK